MKIEDHPLLHGLVSYCKLKNIEIYIRRKNPEEWTNLPATNIYFVAINHMLNESILYSSKLDAFLYSDDERGDNLIKLTDLRDVVNYLKI